MFETAELGQRVGKAEYAAREPRLREQLLRVQRKLAKRGIPVIVLFGGVDLAGKSECAGQLTAWMDPRHIAVRAYDEPTQEERERPDAWRYWRDLPRKGEMGIFLSAWYSRPFLDRVYQRASSDHFDVELERILAFERTLALDGALVVKFWLHLSRDAQARRLEAFREDDLQRWRVREVDEKHLGMYDDFTEAAEHMLVRTSVGHAPWTVVEGEDERFRSLQVGTLLLEAIEARLERDTRIRKARKAAAREREAGKADPADEPAADDGDETLLHLPTVTVLDALDTSRRLPKKTYRTRLQELHGRLHRLRLAAREADISTIVVFEGWDAAGKGGAIRRLIAPLDARRVQVIPIAAPTDEELAHHYLWRFWRHLPRSGRVTIFDRSWYGRVLVERVEGLAREREWRRAYAEINEFEQQLIEHGDVLVKFWLHIDPEEQAARFEAREHTPHKSWKLTEEDWRNREHWNEYEQAVNEMVARTSTRAAPWHLIEANDKRHARIRVLEATCEMIERRLARVAHADGSPYPADVTGERKLTP